MPPERSELSRKPLSRTIQLTRTHVYEQQETAHNRQGLEEVVSKPNKSQLAIGRIAL